jgi:hypothetical protein
MGTSVLMIERRYGALLDVPTSGLRAVSVLWNPS